MAVPPPAKRQRRWAPKSRRACKSCKQRRLRCDETKPNCQRCIKDGFTCEWDAHATAAATLGQSPARVNRKSPNDRVMSTDVSSPPEIEDDNAPRPSEAAVVTRLNQSEAFNNLSPVVELVTYQTPSSPYSKLADYNYLAYFLSNVAPLLATTKPWQTLWKTTIPQCAWTSDAVRHGMIAVAASYEGFRSEIEAAPARRRKKCEPNLVVLREVNAAISAFRREEGSKLLLLGTERVVADDVGRHELDVALLLCRILASVAQAQSDWRLASAHLAWGARMLRQVAKESRRCGKLSGVSDIVRTMAPTFMNLLHDSLDDRDLVNLELLSEDKAKIWAELVRFRTRYRLFFQKWMNKVWPLTSRVPKSYLLTAWSTLNMAMSSALYPDLVYFGDSDPIKAVDEVRKALAAKGELYSLEQLAVVADSWLEGMDAHLNGLPQPQSMQNLVEHLQTCFENYLVQASNFEPLMSAGTFWSHRSEWRCSVMLRLEQYRAGEMLPRMFGERMVGHHHHEKREDLDEVQNFYLEHVCPYRSGLIPAPLDGDLCCLTTIQPSSLDDSMTTT